MTTNCPKVTNKQDKIMITGLKKSPLNNLETPKKSASNFFLLPTISITKNDKTKYPSVENDVHLSKVSRSVVLLQFEGEVAQ